MTIKSQYFCPPIQTLRVTFYEHILAYKPFIIKQTNEKFHINQTYF